MTDTTADTATTAPTTVATFELPNLTGERSFDCATIPADARLELLKSAVRGYIANRVNAAFQRHAKDESVLAWGRYDEATKADPLQSAVAKPEGERPAAADLEKAYAGAIEALTKGDIRRQSGEPKARKVKDPLIATITDIVQREVFTARKAADPKYTYIQARKDVGIDGLAYLNTLIDAKVAAVAEAEQPALRAQLEKMREAKYVAPAKLMLGISDTKAMKELPSIL